MRLEATLRMDKGHYYRREILSVGASTLCTSPLVAHLPSCLQERSETTPGTILICGGGKLPDSILDRFCEFSDLKNSTLVLIPTASARSDSGDYSPWLELWKSRGWQDVLVVHSSDNRTTKDPKFAEQIDQAQAVWITGGDQSRLSERFSGTVLIERLNHLLQRGGVLGGTSAGAAILSKTMIAGGISEPVMSEGFGILPGVIVDQHFTQKNRFERLAKAVAMHRKLIGIGIDESTGLELRGSKAKVIGLGRIHAYRDQSSPVHWSQEDPIDPSQWSELFVTSWSTRNQKDHP
ncbi:MAG: cyanophycinase [Planctomycetaceae bacterium]|nr:cyanophycinase [Planctomycetaceae bacterium]MCE2813895.1 cyanophycinase [Planctomycetaceae bacterium]